MADQCMLLEDPLFVSDAASLRIGLLPLADRLAVQDGTVFGRSTHVSDALAIADTAELHPTVLVKEALQVDDYATVVGVFSVITADTLTLRDACFATLVERVFEPLLVSDGATLRRYVAIGDALRVSEIAIPVRRAARQVTDRLRIADQAVVSVHSTMADVLHASDGITFLRSMQAGDSLRIDDGDEAGRSVVLVVGDLMHVGDGGTLVARASFLAADAFVAEDQAILPLQGAAWTANTDTWAASRYADWPITSLTAIDGALFGAGPGGLYALDGDSDDGLAINASVLTDQRPGGPEASLRHGGYLYAAMRSAGQMGARVLAWPKGAPASYTYVFEDRRNDAIGPMRMKYGRGIKSLMWQFEISNKEGADFRIAGGLAWVTDPGSRKV